MKINNKKFIAYRYSSHELKLKNDYLKSFIVDNKVDILYNNEISIFELLIILDYYKSLNVQISLTLSYLPYQRMDHPNTNEVETVRHVANIFNSFNLENLYICEPHCTLNYFANSKKINLVDKLFYMATKQINFDTNKDCVIFTDKGSVSKYSHLCSNYVYGQKVRDSKTGLISSYCLNGKIYPNQKILIIDDIMSSGDTIDEILTLLKEYDNEIYVLCAHLEKNKYNKRIINDKKIKLVIASNSLTKKASKKVKLYKIENLVN